MVQVTDDALRWIRSGHPWRSADLITHVADGGGAGNRTANRALHMIVIVRLRYCEQTKVYMERRTTEGRTKKEVICCLKRYVAREIHRTLRADLSTLELRT